LDKRFSREDMLRLAIMLKIIRFPLHGGRQRRPVRRKQHLILHHLVKGLPIDWIKGIPRWLLGGCLLCIWVLDDWAHCMKLSEVAQPKFLYLEAAYWSNNGFWVITRPKGGFRFSRISSVHNHYLTRGSGVGGNTTLPAHYSSSMLRV